MGGYVRAPTDFVSDGVTLRGYFYVPASVEVPCPAVVMSHGWGASLRMGLESYAERFAAAGFAVLVYDNPNIGLSDGEPRFEINPWVRARATRHAVGHAARFGQVDSERIALWGDSGDAVRVFLNAAVDDRVAAVVSYNPTFGDTIPVEPPDPSLVVGIRAVLEAETLPSEMQATFGPALVVSGDPNVESMSPSPQAFRWFFEYGGRHGTGWQNRWTYASNKTDAPFSPYDCLPAVSVPVLLVTGRDDEIDVCDSDVQRHALTKLGGPATWHEIDGGHFGALYTDSTEFEDAVSTQIEFLTGVLAAD